MLSNRGDFGVFLRWSQCSRSAVWDHIQCFAFVIGQILKYLYSEPRDVHCAKGVLSYILHKDLVHRGLWFFFAFLCSLYLCIVAVRNNFIVHCASSGALFRATLSFVQLQLGKTIFYILLHYTLYDRKQLAASGSWMQLIIIWWASLCLSMNKTFCCFCFSGVAHHLVNVSLHSMNTVSLHCLLSLSLSSLPTNQTLPSQEPLIS